MPVEDMILCGVVDGSGKMLLHPTLKEVESTRTNDHVDHIAVRVDEQADRSCADTGDGCRHG